MSDAKRRRGFLFRRNEWWGLFAMAIGSTSMGIGLYWTIWFALRPLYYRSIVYAAHGMDWLLFLVFYGLGGVLLAIGRIELRDALPAHRAPAILAAEAVLRERKRAGRTAARHEEHRRAT